MELQSDIHKKFGADTKHNKIYMAYSNEKIFQQWRQFLTSYFNFLFYPCLKTFGESTLSK